MVEEEERAKAEEELAEEEEKPPLVVSIKEEEVEEREPPGPPEYEVIYQTPPDKGMVLKYREPPPKDVKPLLVALIVTTLVLPSVLLPDLAAYELSRVICWQEGGFIVLDSSRGGKGFIDGIIKAFTAVRILRIDTKVKPSWECDKSLKVGDKIELPVEEGFYYLIVETEVTYLYFFRTKAYRLVSVNVFPNMRVVKYESKG